MKPVHLPRMLRAPCAPCARPPHVEIFGLLHSQPARLIVIILFLLSVICVMPIPSAGAPPDGAADTARTSAADQPAIVISQVYTGGGMRNALYQNDFIELHNAGQTAVSVSGWSVQYEKTGFRSVIEIAGTIPSGGYYLVWGNSTKACDGAACGAPLPPADASSNPLVELANGTGTVYLVTHSGDIDIGCGFVPGVVDKFGYGTATCQEGDTPAPGGTSTQAFSRLDNGCQDQDQNATDFVMAAPSPRNSQSPVTVCKPNAVSLTGAQAARMRGPIAWLAVVALLALVVTARFLVNRTAPPA